MFKAYSTNVFIGLCCTMGILLLKDSQRDLLVEYFHRQKDLLGILPTGYGKSLLFQLPAMVEELSRLLWNSQHPNKINDDKEVIVLIVPLVAIADDQEQVLRRLVVHV
mgnify:CR=1 FL=1